MQEGQLTRMERSVCQIIAHVGTRTGVAGRDTMTYCCLASGVSCLHGGGFCTMLLVSCWGFHRCYQPVNIPGVGSSHAVGCRITMPWLHEQSRPASLAAADVFESEIRRAFGNNPDISKALRLLREDGKQG